MSPTKQLYDQLIRDEGVVLTAYKDTEGFVTVGVGHNLDAKPISHAAAFVILSDDIRDAQDGLLARWPWMSKLSPARFGSMTNLAFNLGIAGLAGFKKFLAAAEKGDWKVAAGELLNSKYATQVGDRAKRVAAQLISDEWV